MSDAGPAVRVRVRAPAKLTLSLEVTGVRLDGYHELRSEMVTLDLADELEFDEAGSGVSVVARPAAEPSSWGPGPRRPGPTTSWWMRCG